jgi:hypothetical protein
MFFNANATKITNAIAARGGAGDNLLAPTRKLAKRAKNTRSTAANIIQDRGYTPVRMTANAVGAFSQAHSENRVYRSGKPAGAIFICEVL